jgi:putative RNA 2'-phosphotransferase
MGLKQVQTRLANFLDYILGRNPHEFGLVPDQDGFIKLKDFFMAIAEEEGWRHVRQPLINELIITMPNPPVEIVENKIRATNRDLLTKIQHAVEIPKLLYTAVSRKSHSVVLEKGVFPTRHEYVILSSEKAMALRIGKRRDSSPVLLTVNVLQTEQQEIFFKQAGDNLYLADRIPVDCFMAPPLPKEKPEIKKPKKRPEPETHKMPGSYTIDLHSKKEKYRKAAKEKDGSWKKNKKRLRKQNREEWPE